MSLLFLPDVAEGVRVRELAVGVAAAVEVARNNVPPGLSAW